MMQQRPIFYHSKFRRLLPLGKVQNSILHTWCWFTVTWHTLSVDRTLRLARSCTFHLCLVICCFRFSVLSTTAGLLLCSI